MVIKRHSLYPNPSTHTHIFCCCFFFFFLSFCAYFLSVFFSFRLFLSSLLCFNYFIYPSFFSFLTIYFFLFYSFCVCLSLSLSVARAGLSVSQHLECLVHLSCCVRASKQQLERGSVHTVPRASMRPPLCSNAHFSSQACLDVRAHTLSCVYSFSPACTLSLLRASLLPKAIARSSTSNLAKQ